MQPQNRIHADRLLKKRGEPDKPVAPWIFPMMYSTVAAVLISLYVAFKTPSPIQSVDIANAPRLRELFYGGVPTALFCSDSLSPKLSESLSTAQSMDGLRGVRVAQVDCVSPVPVSSLFPQGKPLLETLGLVAIDGTAPSAFHAATVTPYQSAAEGSTVETRDAASVTPASSLSITGFPFSLFPPAPNSNPLLAAHSLLTHALAAAPPAPGAGAVTLATSPASLSAACPHGRACLILAAPGPLPAAAAAAATRLARRYRAVSVVVVNTLPQHAVAGTYTGKGADTGEGVYTLAVEAVEGSVPAAAAAAVAEAEAAAAGFAAAVAKAEAASAAAAGVAATAAATGADALNDEAAVAAAAAAEAASASSVTAETAALVSPSPLVLPSFLPKGLTQAAAAAADAAAADVAARTANDASTKGKGASKGVSKGVSPVPAASIAVIAVRPVALTAQSAAAAARVTAPSTNSASSAGVDAMVARVLLTPLPRSLSSATSALDALAAATFGSHAMGLLPALDAARVAADGSWLRLGKGAKVGEGKGLREKEEASAAAAAASVAADAAAADGRVDDDTTAAAAAAAADEEEAAAAAEGVDYWRPKSAKDDQAAAETGVSPFYWVRGPPSLVPVSMPAPAAAVSENQKD